MRIVMTLLVRDEQDIIGENIEYHLSQGVDFIIATDNRSVDATAAILKRYESRGVLRYLYEQSDDYSQTVWVTRMARLAATAHAADWVINNDADEFWWPQSGNLKDAFDALPRTTNIIEASRHNFVTVDHDLGTFAERMVYRERVSKNLFGSPLPPKVAHRGCPSIVVAQGNHSVTGLADPETARDCVEIFHYPVRSFSQIYNKIAKGGAAYERNTVLPSDLGGTWRELYKQLQADGLRQYFDETFHDKARLAERLKADQIVMDRRLADYLASHLHAT
jgi:hypothetical protein